MQQAQEKAVATTPAKLAKYQRRYGEIIDAAAAVFAEKGYHGSSTKDIADRLGIRQGSLYYYFTSKEAALEEVCARGVEGFVQGLEDIIAKGGPTRVQVRAAILNHLQPLHDRPNYVQTFLRERRALPKASRRKIGTASRNYEALLEGVFRSGIESGELRADLDCRMTTLAVLGMCNAVSSWYRKGAGASLEHIVDCYADLILEGIRAG